MKLVVYDDLPSPSLHQHRNSLSAWLNESRHLASRASTRASMTMKRSSTTPLKIGAPSDFRRVQSFQSPGLYAHALETVHSPASKYQPLDLRIHRSGNRLSDLPSFESFQLESPQRKTLPAPVRALTTSTGVRDRRCQTTFTVSRKPVGSQNRRSLGNLEPLVFEKPIRITSSLVPHFSKVTPVEIPIQEAQTSPVHGRSKSDGSQLASTSWPQDAQWGSMPQTPTKSIETPTLSPSKSTPKESPISQSQSYPTPTTPTPLSNRITEWMFPDKQVPKQTDKFTWERTRTLSGTTAASTPVSARARNNSSISSVFSSALTPRTSFSIHPDREKDLDAGVHPTIFEGERQDHPFYGYREDRDGTRFESGIGVAF